MNTVEEGNICPEFSFVSTDEKFTSLKNLKGKNIVLYFYPRDNTPGCTDESLNFKEHYLSFKQLNTEIVGISRDSLASHLRFLKKLNLPFSLISDENETICHLFDVIKDKNMYGKKIKGIERSTFFINTSGKLIKAWRKVKVPGHVIDVLSFIKENK